MPKYECNKCKNPSPCIVWTYLCTPVDCASPDLCQQTEWVIMNGEGEVSK